MQSSLRKNLTIVRISRNLNKQQFDRSQPEAGRCHAGATA